MDRTDLASSRYWSDKEENRCISEDQPIAKLIKSYGFPNWSFSNCLVFYTRYFFPNCNIMAPIGLNNTILKGTCFYLDSLKSDPNDSIWFKAQQTLSISWHIFELQSAKINCGTQTVFQIHYNLNWQYCFSCLIILSK